MITIEQAEKLFNKENGIEYFIKELVPTIDDSDYWTILRTMWIDRGSCDKTWEDLIFRSGRKREHKIMKSSDRQALKKLPKKVKVFRVCFEKEDEVQKWNWTTDRAFAERYLTRRIKDGAYIAEKIVDKKEIFAFFNSRGESEVILFKK